MNILVTGAYGFVGRHLVNRLLEGGLDGAALGSGRSAAAKAPRITVFLLKSESVPESYKGKVDVVHGDLRDIESVRTAVTGKDIIFHIAGYISYWSRDIPILKAVNVDGVATLLDEAIKAGVKKFIHVSSVGAVGFHSDGTLADEDTAFNWPEDFGYMTTKRDGQKLVLAAAKERGLHAVVVNPASIMGPGDPIVTTPHNKLYKDMYSKPFFFGTFTGGLAVVDVRDLVELILAAAKKGRKGESYLAIGANVRYAEVLRLMALYAKKRFIAAPIPGWLLTCAGWCAELIAGFTKKRPLITAAYGRLSGWIAYYSARKSIEELGAQYRPLEETIRDGCAFFESNFLPKKE